MFQFILFLNDISVFLDQRIFFFFRGKEENDLGCVFVSIGKAVIAESFFSKVRKAYGLNNEVRFLETMHNAECP